MIPEISAGTLAQVETWITAPAVGGDGWGEVKPCVFVRLTATDGTVGWGEAFVLPGHGKTVAETIHKVGRHALTFDQISPGSFRDWAMQKAASDRSMDFVARSALDMAVCDLCGKRSVRIPFITMLPVRKRQRQQGDNVH